MSNELRPGDTLRVVNEDGSDTGLVAIWRPKKKPRPTYLNLVQYEPSRKSGDK